MHSPPSRPGPGLGDGDLLSGFGARDDTQRVVCEHADRCGGCPIIALPYGEQLATEARARRAVGLALPGARARLHRARRTPPIRSSSTARARSSSSRPAASSASTRRAAATRSSTSRSCRVALAGARGGRARAPHPHRRATSATRRAARARSTRAAGGALRAVDLREVRRRTPRRASSSRSSFSAIASRPRRRSRTPRARSPREAPRILGVALNFHDGDSPQILGSETVVVHGVASAPDRIGARDAPGDVRLVRAGAPRPGGARARDRRSSCSASIVDGREAERSPARARSLRRLGRHRARARRRPAPTCTSSSRSRPPPRTRRGGAQAQGLPVRAEAADVASALRRSREQKASFDAVVVNPPRRGMSPLARELARAPRACRASPTSRAIPTRSRAISITSPASATASTTLRPLDMIPLTDEVETIARPPRDRPRRAEGALRRRGDPHRREGRARADDAAGRVRRRRSLARVAQAAGRERGRARSPHRRRHERARHAREARPTLARGGRPSLARGHVAQDLRRRRRAA